MKKTKRIFTTILVLVFVLGSISSSTLAVGTESAETVTANSLSNIPVYFTETNNELASIQATAQAMIDNDIITQTESYPSSRNTTNILVANTNDLIITKISNDEREAIMTNPLFAATFDRVESLVNDGVDVSYINFYVPQVFSSLTNDPDDPNYWESICSPLGTYNGYTFLCLDADIGNVTTGWFESNPSLVSWSALAKATINFTIDYFVDNELFTTAASVVGTLADFFNVYTPPLAITFNSSTDYEMHRVIGPLTVRTVYISDNLDKMDGYAYYPWGTTERAALRLDVDAQWPVKQLPTGGYTYESQLGTIKKQSLSTPGHWGNTFLFTRVLQKYLSTGYSTYSETIDIQGAVADMLISSN